MKFIAGSRSSAPRAILPENLQQYAALQDANVLIQDPIDDRASNDLLRHGPGHRRTAYRPQAQLETQQQVVARLEAGTRPEEIRKARAALEAITATAADAASKLARIRKLHEMKVSTREERDDAEAVATTTAAQQKSAQAALDLAVTGPRKEDILEAKAALKGQEAVLPLAQRDLKSASLHAPSDGIIRNRSCRWGTWPPRRSPLSRSGWSIPSGAGPAWQRPTWAASGPA